jgi:hypothetical protein
MPGATPNETISANESSTLPISDDALSNLARKPSRKSNIAAIPIIHEAITRFPEKRKTSDKQPDNKLKIVNKLGS